MIDEAINIYAIRNPRFKINADETYRMDSFIGDFINIAWCSETISDVIDVLNQFNHIIKSENVLPLFEGLTLDSFSLDDTKTFNKNIPSNEICRYYMTVTKLDTCMEGNYNLNVLNALKQLCDFWKKGYVIVGNIAKEQVSPMLLNTQGFYNQVYKREVKVNVRQTQSEVHGY